MTKKATPQAGIDLDALQNATPEDLTHKVGIDFDDDGVPTVGFIIVGKDSPQYLEAAKRQRVSGIKRQAVKSQRIDTKTDDGAETLDRLILANQTEIATAVTVGWFGFTSGGAPAAFSAEEVRKVFEKRPTWRDKVLAGLEAEDNFLPKSRAT